ncbi:MAG: VOC family protein [Alphaproteobacteria bacterium]|nr:VOC family protein [Alphaproteobacteria bacterium]MBV9694937.1 VOC family protein [Alphaproteobacteria bacterium]
MGHITGVGGVFIKARDAKALREWYRDVLGIDIQNWGGAALSYDAPGHPSVVVFALFGHDSKYFDPSTRDVMINFAVDDLDAMLERLEAKGVKVLGRDDTGDPNGRFAWIMDPEGAKIELWQENKK